MKLIALTNNEYKRNELVEGIALALRELANKKEIDDEVRDLISFIIILLRKITSSIDTTATAWEKRNYWLKVDRYRKEWEWCKYNEAKLLKELKENDWEAIFQNLNLLLNRCAGVNIRKKMITSKPWLGAFQLLSKELR